MPFKRVPESLKNYILTGESFVILGHKDPDGDCIGSQIALGLFLHRIGKSIQLVSPGPFRRKEVLPFKDQFNLHIEPESGLRTRAIVVDCSTKDRIGHLADELGGRDVAVIDHHTGETGFGPVRYLDSSAPSVSFLVQRLIESMGYRPDEDESYFLFLGLCTDTGFFRHLEQDSGEIFKASGRLLKGEVSPRRIFRDLFADRSLASRRYVAAAVLGAERHFDGRLLIASPDPSVEVADEDIDNDSIYQLLVTVRDVEAVALIREETQGEISVSLRSAHNFNVADIARNFGGGGHVRAAGFTLNKPIEEIRQDLVAAFGKAFGPV